MEKKHKYSQYIAWGVTAFAVIAAGVLFYFSIDYMGSVINALSKLMGILSPFIWGLVISYLLIPSMMMYERRLFKPLAARINKTKPRIKKDSKLPRVLSLILAEIVMLLIITALFYLIVPQVYDSISAIITNSPSYFDTAYSAIDNLLKGFISGKLLDSAIIGVLCYLGCLLLKMPYALLISVIVGVTNVIPFFGPFIGAVPSALLVLLVDPKMCLWFIIFVFVLQQLDGNVIGPKILGTSIGINGFWVLFSIVLFGGIFGFWGMLLGVPVFVIIYTALTMLIDRKLKRHKLPTDANEYMNLDYIDPETLQPVPKRREKKDGDGKK